jgi:thiol-disulfide isomerase/thioredoxin
MKFTVSTTLFILLTACAGLSLQAQSRVPVVKFDWYESLRQKPDDTLRIVNFWATWCIPCVEELPHFEAVREKYRDRPLKVILISLDFVKNLEKTLVPFLRKRGIKSEVVLLNEPDYNAWIDKVHPSWSGALPATVFMRNSEKQYRFAEKDFTFAELDSVIKTLLPR